MSNISFPFSFNVRIFFLWGNFQVLYLFLCLFNTFVGFWQFIDCEYKLSYLTEMFFFLYSHRHKTILPIYLNSLSLVYSLPENGIIWWTRYATVTNTRYLHSLCLHTRCWWRQRQRAFISHPLSCNTKWLWQGLHSPFLFLLSPVLLLFLHFHVLNFFTQNGLNYTPCGGRGAGVAHACTKRAKVYWLHISINSLGLAGLEGCRGLGGGAVISPMITVSWQTEWRERNDSDKKKRLSFQLSQQEKMVGISWRHRTRLWQFSI